MEDGEVFSIEDLIKEDGGDTMDEDDQGGDNNEHIKHECYQAGTQGRQSKQQRPISEYEGEKLEDVTSRSDPSTPKQPKRINIFGRGFGQGSISRVAGGRSASPGGPTAAHPPITT